MTSTSTATVPRQRYLNEQGLSLPIAVFLATDHYDHNNTPNTISATALLKPLRQLILSQRVPLSESVVDVSSQFASRIGTAIHDGIEKAWQENYQTAMISLGYPEKVINRIRLNPTSEQLAQNKQIIPVYFEQRVSRTIEVDGVDFTITGKFDFIADGGVKDFKSMTTYKYTKNLGTDKFIKQGSIYRWLEPNLITRDVFEIIYIFLDWKAHEAYKPDYPKHNIVSETYALKSQQETDKMVRDKLSQIIHYRDLPESDLPLCSKEDLWQDDPVWKYYKDRNKTSGKSTKNFTNSAEAYARLSKDGNTGLVKEVPSQAKACKYCPAFPICTQKDDLIRSGALQL